MNTTNVSNYPESSERDTPPRKEFKNLIIGLLAVGLIGSAGYALYSNNDHKQVQQTEQAQISKVTDD